ncbi:hypothetical protein NDU88_007774 [Pleurodeles waltl]|uniref:Uncharacterized protein n=1 Tax=Pleurodeles waltl TaxID=8319 RepID=A0AAV7PNJ3_PLEWA|nr:hypothetical protein NDU88_007774 [Pleurodeles waltl]
MDPRGGAAAPAPCDAGVCHPSAVRPASNTCSSSRASTSQINLGRAHPLPEAHPRPGCTPSSTSNGRSPLHGPSPATARDSVPAGLGRRQRQHTLAPGRRQEAAHPGPGARSSQSSPLGPRGGLRSAQTVGLTGPTWSFLRAQLRPESEPQHGHRQSSPASAATPAAKSAPFLAATEAPLQQHLQRPGQYRSPHLRGRSRV